MRVARRLAVVDRFLHPFDDVPILSKTGLHRLSSWPNLQQHHPFGASSTLSDKHRLGLSLLDKNLCHLALDESSMGGLGNAKDVVSLLKDIVALASSVVKLGETWYHASEALDEFERNVGELKRKLQSWQSRAQRYGLLSDTNLSSALERVKEDLQLEEAKLKNLDRCGCGCFCLWLRLSSETDFPADLRKTIVDLDNTIASKWKAEASAEDAARRRAEILARSPTFTFKQDPRYVRLPIIEEEVKNALNNVGNEGETVRVVLLYGRAGSGKSSLAHNLALEYKSAAAFAADHCASNSATGCRFDNVFHLNCGPEADSEAKQLQLFSMLNWRSSDTEKEKYKDSKNVKPILRQLLKDSRSLVIFDDVWEELFLKEMVGVCGEHMRILVTSQKQYVCENSLREKTKSISMDQITRDDSLRILKVQTGFDNEESIPEEVEKCMESLVERVCGHPHALASVATAIPRQYNTDVVEWENAIREYDQLLDDSLSNVVFNPIHDIQYERSVTEAIQMKFRRLGKEEIKLLVLMVMLKGPSMAEDVLRLFHAEIIAQEKLEGIRSYSSFSKARTRLEDLQCIKTGPFYQEQFRFWGGGHCPAWWGEFRFGARAWSMHSLDEQFIKRKMKKDIAAMLKAVKDLPDKEQGLKAGPQLNATKVLGSLLFRSPFSKQIGKLACSLGDPHSRDFIFSPITHLMVKNIGDGWCEASQRSSDQMFLDYVTDGWIHYDNALALLNSLTSKHALSAFMICFEWSAMSWRAMSNKWSIHEDVIVSVLRIFGGLKSPMDRSVVRSLNPEQWNTLLYLVSRGALYSARFCVFQMKDFVLGLNDMLTSACCPQNIKHLSAVVLSYLVPLMDDKPSQYGQERMASIPLVIERLVHSLQENSNRKAQEEASRALYALAQASNFDVKQKMISIGFDQFMGNVGGNKDVELERLAIRTLACLVADNVERSYLNCSQDSASAIEDLSNYLTEIVVRCSGDANDFQKIHDVFVVLMWIDPEKGKSIILDSCFALELRGSILKKLGNYQDSVNDFEKARQLNPTGFLDDGALTRVRWQLQDFKGLLEYYDDEVCQTGEAEVSPLGYKAWYPYLRRGILKRVMGDLPGALEDLDKSFQLSRGKWTPLLLQRGYVKFLLGDEEGAQADIKDAGILYGCNSGNEQFFYQERGVLKRLMGDLPGALEDLDTSLQLDPNDYEVLKHRGYVKFLMDEEEGARADAEEALRVRTSRDDEPGLEYECLGTSIVEFLSFRL